MSLEPVARSSHLIQYAVRTTIHLDRINLMKRLLLALLPIFLSSVSIGQVTVIRAGRLVDPDSGTVLTDQKILIVGNKISAVGKELRIPGDAKWIDLSTRLSCRG